MVDPIVVKLPNTVRVFREDLSTFFYAMLFKLHKNSWKDTPTKETLPDIVSYLREEIAEFEDQVKVDRYSDNTLMELADIANFAFLAYVALQKEKVILK